MYKHKVSYRQCSTFTRDVTEDFITFADKLRHFVHTVF